jgi:hypothetical protein
MSSSPIFQIAGQKKAAAITEKRNRERVGGYKVLVRKVDLLPDQ